MNYLCGLVLTLIAMYLSFKLGSLGASPPKLLPKRRKERMEERKRNIIAQNIDRYDGTARGQREVK